MDQPGKVANPEQGKWNLPCPRTRLRVWPRETGSAVLSRVSPLILHTQTESGAYSRDSSRFPGGVHIFIETTIRQRASPDLIGSRNCVPMAFTASAGTGPVVFKLVSSNGCCHFSGHHGPINARLSFPHPLLV